MASCSNRDLTTTWSPTLYSSAALRSKAPLTGGVRHLIDSEVAWKAILFAVSTPLGFRVRVTRSYWEFIVTVKHPVMRERGTAVQDVLHPPDEVRQSRSDPAVFLFYRAEVPGRWIGAVAKRLNDEGFLITTYPTDAVKEGERVWSK